MELNKEHSCTLDLKGKSIVRTPLPKFRDLSGTSCSAPGRLSEHHQAVRVSQKTIFGEVIGGAIITKGESLTDGQITLIFSGALPELIHLIM